MYTSVLEYARTGAIWRLLVMKSRSPEKFREGYERKKIDKNNTADVKLFYNLPSNKMRINLVARALDPLWRTCEALGKKAKRMHTIHCIDYCRNEYARQARNI